MLLLKALFILFLVLVHNEYPYIQLGLHFPFLLNFALDTSYLSMLPFHPSITIFFFPVKAVSGFTYKKNVNT